MEVGEVIAQPLWHLELLPGLVTSLLTTFGVKEDADSIDTMIYRGEREGEKGRGKKKERTTVKL